MSARVPVHDGSLGRCPECDGYGTIDEFVTSKNRRADHDRVRAHIYQCDCGYRWEDYDV